MSLDDFDDRDPTDDLDDDLVNVLPSADSSQPLFDEADQAELDDIRSVRMRLMSTLSTAEKPIPESSAEKIMLMQLIDGREKAVMTKKRLRIASKMENSASNLAALVAATLLDTKIERPPIQRPSNLSLDSNLKHSKPVPGMMDVGTVPVRYDDIVQKDN